MTVSDTGGKPRRTLSLKRESAAAPKIEERLHKVLAQAGLGSRRALEERIASGQIKVNGEIAQVGSSVKTGDRIELDGKVFVASALTDAPRVLIYNKPEGEVTTREDPEGRPTVFDNLPPLKGSRWIAVGRLDINTTGLLLLTTDGDLANALMHPSTEVRREYVCRIQGEVDDGVLEKLARGVELEDGMAKFDEIERIGSSDSHAWFRVVLHEGRNREVRRLWETVGFQVSRLKRTRYGSVELPRLLKRGHSEELPGAGVEEMRNSLKLDPPGGVLTLQSVIGQRRAKASEYKPGPREQRAWTNGGYAADEGRELRAFDTLRDDRPARPAKSRFGAKPGGKPGGRPAGPGGPGGKPGGRRGGARAGGTDENRGNRLTAPGGQQRGQGGPRRAKDGAPPGFENPNEFRSWYVPEGVTTTSRVAPPRAQAKPGARPANPYGGKPGPRGAGAPSGRPGGAGKPGGGRPAGAGGGRPNPGPGGARSGAGPGGPRAAGPAGGRPGPRNNKPRRGGPGPNRGG